MSALDHINWGGGYVELADSTTIRWTARVNQDAKDCEIGGPLWKGKLVVSGIEEVQAGSFEAAVRQKLKFMTTRGDTRLQWFLNPPQPEPITYWLIKNTSDETLTYQNERLEHVKIGPGETVRYPINVTPVILFERSDEEVKSLTREATSEEAEIVSQWDPRTWIAPEKSINKPLKRIDKIAKY